MKIKKLKPEAVRLIKDCISKGIVTHSGDSSMGKDPFGLIETNPRNFLRYILMPNGKDSSILVAIRKEENPSKYEPPVNVDVYDIDNTLGSAKKQEIDDKHHRPETRILESGKICIGIPYTKVMTDIEQTPKSGIRFKILDKGYCEITLGDSPLNFHFKHVKAKQSTD